MKSDNASSWKISKCNCPAFLKNYVYKHVVGMAIRLKYCKPSAAAKIVPLGEKRKRGRPAKAKTALSRLYIYTKPFLSFILLLLSSS